MVKDVGGFVNDGKVKVTAHSLLLIVLLPLLSFGWSSAVLPGQLNDALPSDIRVHAARRMPRCHTLNPNEPETPTPPP